MKKRPRSSIKRSKLGITDLDRLIARQRIIDEAQAKVEAEGYEARCIDASMKITKVVDLLPQSKFHVASGNDMPLGGRLCEVTFKDSKGQTHTMPVETRRVAD